MKKTKFILISSILIFTSAFLFWRYRFTSAKSKQLNLIRPQKRKIVKTLELSGKIKAKKQANLHFQTGGLVVYYPWQEGDKIKKFQTIASLDQRQLRKTLQEKLNLYAKQRNSFDQTQDDYRKNIDDGDIDLKLKRLLENVQYDLNNAVLNVEIQHLSLEYSHLWAPFSGILIKSPITSSQVNITPADVFVLVDPNSLYFSAELEEGDLTNVSQNTPVKVSLDAFPQEMFPAHIKRIAFSSIETSSGTIYPLEITLDNPDLSKLRLGLNGTAYLTLASKESALALPLDVIHEDDQGSFVYVYRDGKKQRQSVKLGLEGDNYVEVLSGLSSNDSVIEN